MSRQHTQIEGYEVELDMTGQSYGVHSPQGFVRFKRYSTDLESLCLYGKLCHDNGSAEHTVPAWVIGRIEAWARERGWP